jgi:hypothetical protein
MKKEEIPKNLCLFFNMVSGDFYYIMPDEVKNLDKYQLPLLKKPSSSCKHCMGRGFEGKHVKMNIFMVCRCMQRCINFEKAKEFIDVDQIKVQQ